MTDRKPDGNPTSRFDNYADSRGLRHAATAYLRGEGSLTDRQVERLCRTLLMNWAMHQVAGSPTGAPVMVVMPHPGAPGSERTMAAVVALDADGDRTDDIFPLVERLPSVMRSASWQVPYPDAPEHIRRRVLGIWPEYDGPVQMKGDTIVVFGISTDWHEWMTRLAPLREDGTIHMTRPLPVSLTNGEPCMMYAFAFAEVSDD